MIQKVILEQLYMHDKLSMMQIAQTLSCSPNKVEYWMIKYGIKRRNSREAIYERSNPYGDPFKMKDIASQDDAFLLGMGIGLYWGEGNKRNKHSVKLGNTDPGIIKMFIRFLVEVCGIDKRKLRYGLQIFSDIDRAEALSFWMEKLGEPKEKFNKTTATPARSIGTYRHKNQTGVLTVYFHNYKLRDIIVELCHEGTLYMPR